MEEKIRIFKILTGFLLFVSAGCFVSCTSSRTYLVKDGTRPRNFTVFFSSMTSCEEVAARYISRAESTTIIHTHSVTSRQIADALIDAFTNRNVHVAVILYEVSSPSLAAYLAEGGVEVYHDTIPTPVSDNMMVIDDEFVFTGTFEFSSEEQDTDYLVVIKDPELASTFTQNWHINWEVVVQYLGKEG